ncbi:hypothetical protein QYF61_006757 [Mycteria americana]|uniref:Uncharacterized protein n=1 Tax=Mycteria americana TaxID=33587 RepID=A0AAN7RQ81_MYCAM|nr:hypothetical protein QYF61_006757 [Mycteria americana]
MCWGLAHAYRALFNTIQSPQGSGDKMADTAATLAPPCDRHCGYSGPLCDRHCGHSSPPATDNAVQPGNQPLSVSVAPIHKKKYWMQKSACLEKEDERAGPSQGDEEEELVNEVETTQSLSLNELRDRQKDFSHHPGDHIVTWLLQCWDSGASSLEFESKEAKQLGSLSRERGIDKVIGKGALAFSLWRRLLSTMKERHLFKEDVIYRPRKRTTMERGVRYLRKLAVLGVIYGDLDNEQLPKEPDEVQCTQSTWLKLVRNAPSSCANSLAILTWKDGEGPTVDEADSQLREYEESISSSLVSAVEKLSQKVQQLEEDRSYFPPVQTSISAIRSQRSSAQERGYGGYTPRGTLGFYLHDHREVMRKWDVKPTSTLEVWVWELQGETVTKGGSSRKIAAPVSSGRFPRQSKRADLTPDFNEGAPDSYVQELGNEYYDQD